MHRRCVLNGVAAVVFLTLSGCLAVENIDSSTAVESAATSTESSVVYGRVRWIENGKEPALEGDILFGQRVVPRIKRVEDNKSVTVELDNTGHFIWPLQQGTYIIDKIQISAPEYGSVYFIPKVAFRVPENGGYYYIGTLRADAVAKSGFWGPDGRAKFSIEDNMQAENKYVRQKLGSSISGARKSLMVQDDNLPDSFDTTPEFEIIMTILGAPW